MRGFNSELFYGHIFSGADSAAPAFLDAPLGGLGVNPSIGQGASYKKIKAFEPICIDFAGAFDGYLVDQTRIFCIGGLPDQLLKAYDDMVRIQNRLLEIARPGVSLGGGLRRLLPVGLSTSAMPITSWATRGRRSLSSATASASRSTNIRSSPAGSTTTC